VHFRRLFPNERSSNEYQNLVAARPQLRDDIVKMILLDFITRQDDRHLSNIALKISGGIESFYPLYDNGRSLFYEDTEETVLAAVKNPSAYATTFGYTGTYWDYVQEIAAERGPLAQFLHLDISEKVVANILRQAGFTGYRYNGALCWILKTLAMIRSL
jgi:hypothetical protein